MRHMVPIMVFILCNVICVVLLAFYLTYLFLSNVFIHDCSILISYSNISFILLYCSVDTMYGCNVSTTCEIILNIVGM